MTHLLYNNYIIQLNPLTVFRIREGWLTISPLFVWGHRETERKDPKKYTIELVYPPTADEFKSLQQMNKAFEIFRYVSGDLLEWERELLVTQWLQKND